MPSPVTCLYSHCRVQAYEYGRNAARRRVSINNLLVAWFIAGQEWILYLANGGEGAEYLEGLRRILSATPAAGPDGAWPPKV